MSTNTISGKFGTIHYTTSSDDYSYEPVISWDSINLVLNSTDAYGVPANHVTITVCYEGLDGDIASTTVVAEKAEITGACVAFASRYDDTDLNDVRRAAHELCRAMGW